MNSRWKLTIRIISFNRISFSYTIDLTSNEAGVIHESITNKDRNIVMLNLKTGFIQNSSELNLRIWKFPAYFLE